MQQQTMGADPEHFIVDTQEGRVVAAHSLGVPTQKGGWDFSGGRAYRDGFALELSPVADECRAMFSNGLMGLYAETLMRLNNVGDGEFYDSPEKLRYQLSMDPLHGFSEEEFRALMEDAPEDLKRFGCSPAYDAYEKGKTIRVSVKPSEWPFRTTGGHMHYTLERVGTYATYTSASVSDELREAVRLGKAVTARILLSSLVKKVDACVGLAYTALFPQEQEEQKIRRGVYGKAGEFRLQIYKRLPSGEPSVWGMEYRTLGPRVFLSSHTVGLFYGLMREVVENGVDFSLLTPEKEKEVRECIQEGDSSGAVSLWSELFPAGVVEHLGSDREKEEEVLLLSPRILKEITGDPVRMGMLQKHSLPWEQEDAHTGWTEFMLDELGLRDGDVCFEIPFCNWCGWCGGGVQDGEGVEMDVKYEREWDTTWIRKHYHPECLEDYMKQAGSRVSFRPVQEEAA